MSKASSSSRAGGADDRAEETTWSVAMRVARAAHDMAWHDMAWHDMAYDMA